MKIAVNTRMLLREHLDGKGRFANETLERITKAHPEHEFYFLFDRPYDPKFIYSSNITPVVVGPVTNKQISYAWWHEITLNKQLEKIKPDLFLSPDGFMPLRSKVKSVAVIHDLSFEHLPHLMPLVMRSYHRTLFPQFARKATRVATVSEFSKRDIAETYNILAEKIDVVYNGASCCFKPLSEEQKEVVKNH